jgi:hypothetical protein
LKHLRGGLTYANVISTICLVLLVGGGTAVAAGGFAKDSVGTRQLKNSAVTAAKVKAGAITGAKIDLASVGTVPSASHAASADTATHAASADSATHAAVADHATTAGDAETLGGIPASGFQRSELEPTHLVGKPGQPPFVALCADSVAPVGFYKDPFGIVHLVGEFAGCKSSQAIFDLPAGFRPVDTEKFAISSGETSVAMVKVEPDGVIGLFGSTYGSFGGISFRTN